MEGKEELVKMRAFKGQRQGVSIENCHLFLGRDAGNGKGA
jgi:hypothetical protein